MLASYGSSPRGAVRVDFLEGEPLIVRLEDDGTVLEALRQEIWECEKQFLLDRSDLDWALDVSPAQLAEADALLIIAMAEPGPSVGRRLSRSRARGAPPQIGVPPPGRSGRRPASPTAAHARPAPRSSPPARGSTRGVRCRSGVGRPVHWSVLIAARTWEGAVTRVVMVTVVVADIPPGCTWR